MKKSELEDRLIRFSTAIIGMKDLMEGFESQHLSKQIIRSGTAVALLYGEAQGAATKRDFIHKISLVLRFKMLETRFRNYSHISSFEHLKS
jgi:four helix bundle protein